MTRSVLWVVLALAPFAGADSAGFRDWGHSPEAYFMTREERREWDAIPSAERAEAFIAEFRARHDRDFVDEVRRRADVVDERLPLGETPTSLTTRGRIVILLGAPSELTIRAFPAPSPGNVGHPLDTRKGGATDHVKFGPTLIAGAGGRVEYTFRYDANAGPGIGPGGWTIVLEADAISGKDRLKHRRQTKRMEEVLDAAARVSLRVAGPAASVPKE